MKLAKILVRQKNNTGLWNAVAGIINAAEAVVLIMVVTRIIGVAEAGVLSIAFAVGNLLRIVGMFGMRTFQVTDVDQKYSFRVYFESRIVSVIIMIMAGVCYLFVNYFNGQYTIEKTLVMIFICVIYAAEAIEDVFWGLYQTKQAIDVGGRMFCYRWTLILCSVICALFLSKNLVISVGIGCIVGVLVPIITIRSTFEKMCSRNEGVSIESIKRILFDKENGFQCLELMKVVFPIFLQGFLSFYILNACKYAIDICYNDEIQAYYGFVSMPVFVIGLISSFFYQPELVKMADDWKMGRTIELRKRVVKQELFVFIASALCLLGAWILGIPVLSLLYGVDLSPYKTILMILLIGGGVYAYNSLMLAVLTLMRKQNFIMWLYITAAVITVGSMVVIVRNYGIQGGAVFFVIVMLLIALAFGVKYQLEFKKMN